MIYSWFNSIIGGSIVDRFICFILSSTIHLLVVDSTSTVGHNQATGHRPWVLMIVPYIPICFH